MKAAEQPCEPTRLNLSVSILMLLAATVVSKLGGAYIVAEFPDRPAPRDTLFELLPYISPARYLTAIALLAAFISLIVYAIRREPEMIPSFVAAFALMYFFRAAIMVLTPLASSYGPGRFVFPIVQHGMFPSGHAGAATLCTLLVDRHDSPRLHWVQAVLMVTVWIALVLAHGHYSIDVVGGALLSYFVYHEWNHGFLLNPFKWMVGCK